MLGNDHGVVSLSIRRPVLTVVINLLVIVAGLAALTGVEVREMPDVDRPVVTIRTAYSGASAETVDTRVTSVIEGAAARVPGVASISSESDYGSSRVTVEFGPEVDLDVATNDLRDAVGTAARRLPEEADEPAIVKADADSQPIMQIAVTSETLPIERLTTIVEDEIVDRVAAVPGVAEVQTYGTRREIIKVTLDTVALASRGLSMAQVEAVLENATFDQPAGGLDAGGQDLVVRANASVATAAEIAALPINGQTRVGDVAAVSAGPDEQISEIRRNGMRGLYLGILRQAQSNTLAISAGVEALVAELNAGLPYDVDLAVVSDDAVFIDGAVREVVFSLLLATAIVIAVIFLFIGNWRATLIPAVSVPISLIGTLVAIWLAGFSINILTLLALVLATGMVVDDAIVVIENVERRRAEGIGPRAAALLGTRQVFFAVIATTATLAAVFIPISFLPGTAGGLFAEFGFVLAIAVALSSFVALTLCPMLASRLGGERRGAGARLFDATFGRVGRAAAGLYRRSLDAALAAPLVVIVGCLAFGAGAFLLFQTLPEELAPAEDRGVLNASIEAPEGVDLAYTQRLVRELEAVFQPLIDSGEAIDVLSVTGRGSASSAWITVRLAHWEERARSQEEIVAALQPEVARIEGARLSTRTSNSLGIRSRGNGLTVALTGPTYDEIADAGEAFAAAVNAGAASLTDAELDYDTSQPELAVEIDRERAADLGIPLSNISTVLNTALDGREATEIFVGDQTIPVIMEVPDGLIQNPEDLLNLYVPAADDRVLPLSSVVTLEEVASLPELQREGQRRALNLSADRVPGFALRDAMTDAEAIADETLPPGIGLLFLGEAATLNETSSGVGLTFIFAAVIVMLVLAAQFESFLSAVIIMLTVPFGLACAVFAMLIFGVTLNLYSQIGLVMLIGIMAKNAILIVEFANQLRDQGMAVAEAVREACLIRFRPIVMTMVTTVLGGVPLLLSAGPGAEARVALGWVVVGGLGLATLVTLFLTPVAFLLLAGLAKPRAAEEARLRRELDDARLKTAT